MTKLPDKINPSARPATGRATVAKRRIPLIGKLLIRKGFTTRLQVREALVEQARTDQPLGDILVRRGAVTREQLHQMVHEQLRLRITYR